MHKTRNEFEVPNLIGLKRNTQSLEKDVFHKHSNEFCLQNSGGLQEPYTVSNAVYAVRKSTSAAAGFSINFPSST